MKNSRHAVEVRNVKKSFYLPSHKNNSLKQAITQVFKKKEKGGDSFTALKDVSFTVEKGDFFGVLGRNGSGKSTLLKIISDIYQPSSGSVRHDGKLVAFIELGVGFKSELSGRDNVFLNGALLGFSRKEIEDMYDEIVEFAELEMFMDQKLKNYSSGMKVRLAFSVAIRAKADILILDEVLAVGDASFQRKCYDYFTELKEANKTIIFVSHSMGLVRKYCNKAVLIDDGRVAYQGTGEQAAEQYNNLFSKPPRKKMKSEIIETETALIENVSVFRENTDSSKPRDNIIPTDSRLMFEITVNCKRENLNLVLAFSARDTSNRTVFATNTKVMGVQMDEIDIGSHTFKFLVDNIFTDGEFTTYATVFDESMEEIYARSTLASKFIISGRDKSNIVAIAHPGVVYDGK